jgi:hypothetical protein
MAIMYRAWFSLRSLARDSRWWTTWPLEASSGAVPVWAAKWCLLGNRPMSPTSPRNVRLGRTTASTSRRAAAILATVPAGQGIVARRRGRAASRSPGS